MTQKTSALELNLRVDNDTVLVQIEYAHAGELLKVINASRSSLRQWLPWVDYVQDMTDLMQLIGYYRRKLANNGALTTCIMHQQRIAGIIGLNFVNWEHRSATIGYWLGEPYRGNGLMRRACQRLVAYGFDELKLHKLHILCAVGNRASQKIPEALNFRQEGRLRDGEWLNDHYVDLFSYGMLNHNWPTVATQPLG